MRSLIVLLLLGAVAVGGASDVGAAGGADDAAAAASAAVGASSAKSAGTSKCASTCHDAVKKLEGGYQRLASDSLACFLPYQGGKTLGTADCCDRAELLLGKSGSLAECLCCPEWAKEVLSALPYSKINTTPAAFLEKLHLCRVPMIGQGTCSAGAAGGAVAAAAAGAPAPAAANGTAAPASASPSPPLEPRPLFATFNLSGVYPWVGFDPKFDAGLLAAQGAQAVAQGQAQRVSVVGASPLYNDYLTGFVAWIERVTPRYEVPKVAAPLPPLPEQYKADVAWVASLRRGPYPDLIKGRPAAYSPARTDPLQNGEIANLPPAPMPENVARLQNVFNPSAPAPVSPSPARP